MQNNLSDLRDRALKLFEFHKLLEYLLPLQIIGSLVEFGGSMLFANHSGSEASTVALHLLSFGQLRFHYGLQLTFVQNSGL